MREKFTDGTWSIDRGTAGPSVYNLTADHANAEHFEYFRIVDPSRQHVIAMVTFASDKVFDQSAENAANAALIASATKIYAALKNALPYLRSHKGQGAEHAAMMAETVLMEARGEIP